MKRTTLVLAMVLTLTGTSAGEIDATSVPTGAAPTIDGCVNDAEWEGALHIQLAPEGEAWLLRDTDGLYVGLRVGKNCIPSLALREEGRIRILHASASLGTAEYERAGKQWKATRAFAWRCRNGQTSTADRDRFLADEGWFATTTGVGRRGEAEYRIASRLLPDDKLAFALVVCRLEPGPPEACAWPATVRDGTRDQNLLFGKTPDLSMDPETWARLELGQAKTPTERLEAALDDVEADAAQDPVGAYLALLDVLAALDADAGIPDRAKQLRRTLEKQKAVAREATAQRKLESALKLAEKKLRDVETRYAGTRAAGIARTRREALRP